MKTILIFICLFAGNLANANTREWTLLDLPVRNNLSYVQFIDEQHGFAAGQDGDKTVLIRTTDAGQHWAVFYISHFQLRTLETGPSGEIYLGGTDLLLNQAGIRVSPDGGDTWINNRTILFPTADTVIQINSSGNGTAIAICNEGKVVITSDYFNTSSIMDSQSGNSLTGGVIIHSGLAFLRAGNQLIRWNGFSFSVIKSFEPNHHIAAVDFINTLQGSLILNQGTFPHQSSAIYITGDGGITWEKSAEFADNTVCRRFVQHSANDYFMFSDNRLFYSTNGGIDWEDGTGFIPVEPVNDIWLVHPDLGYAVGNHGEMAKLGGESLGVAEPETNGIVYPNPADDKVHLLIRDNFRLKIMRIIDISGRMISAEGYTQSGPEYIIPVADLLPGVYFILMEDGSRHRFVKS